MKPNTDALHLLLDRERSLRDERQQALQAHQDRERLTRHQWEQLLNYRDGYVQHWQAQFQRGSTPQVMQVYRQFEERLNAALAQQAHTLRHVEGLVAQARAQLLAQELKVATIEKLMDRRLEKSAERARLLEQRQNDDWAQRAHRSRQQREAEELAWQAQSQAAEQQAIEAAARWNA